MLFIGLIYTRHMRLLNPGRLDPFERIMDARLQIWIKPLKVTMQSGCGSSSIWPLKDII